MSRASVPPWNQSDEFFIAARIGENRPGMRSAQLPGESKSRINIVQIIFNF
jgi:hypothetical protein